MTAVTRKEGGAGEKRAARTCVLVRVPQNTPRQVSRTGDLTLRPGDEHAGRTAQHGVPRAATGQSGGMRPRFPSQ